VRHEDRRLCKEARADQKELRVQLGAETESKDDREPEQASSQLYVCQSIPCST